MGCGLKSLLTKHYIGAIVIALLISSGIQSVIFAIAQSAEMILTRSRMNGMTFGIAQQNLWNIVVLGLLRAVLSLGAAYLLAVWMYGKSRTDETPRAADSLE